MSFLQGEVNMIYTSYFAKSAHLDNAICITITTPKFFKGESYHDLAPTGRLMIGYKSGKITKKEYRAAYFKLHFDRGLDPVKVAADLDGKVLLCWERSNAFCHRHLAAEWLNRAGFRTKELS